jgi:hypothetical protein
MNCQLKRQWEMAVLSVLQASQRELTCCLALPFLYNPKVQQVDFSACYLIHGGFFIGLSFDPEDGENMFL